MKKTSTIIVVMLIMLSLSLITCSSKTKNKAELLFENFKWGNNIEEVKEVIFSMKRSPIELISNNLAYMDVILNEDVTRGFYFTPKTQKLYMMGLLWETNRVNDRLLEIIKEKYGNPIILHKNIRKYQQGDSIIILETRFLNTLLICYSNKYRNINKQESEGL